VGAQRLVEFRASALTLIYQNEQIIISVIMHPESIIKKLNLIKHPEGGYYRETYRSEGIIPKSVLPDTYSGNRNYATLIYYMLVGNDISCLHKLPSDEIWHFYEGSPLLIYMIDTKGKLEIITLGNEIDKGEVFHFVVKAGVWFGAEVVDKSSYSLMGCTVAPGFHFDDDIIGKRDELISMFPQYKELIMKMTND
jgi:predicted cupin superfamily sugar epimerase